MGKYYPPRDVVRQHMLRAEYIEDQLREQRAMVAALEKLPEPLRPPTIPVHLQGIYRRRYRSSAEGGGYTREFVPRWKPTFSPMAPDNPFRKRVRSVPTFKPMAADNPFRVRTGVRPGTEPFKF
jgi:hypothetical protein